jgi:hypothetical protein
MKLLCRVCACVEQGTISGKCAERHVAGELKPAPRDFVGHPQKRAQLHENTAIG